MAVPGENAGDIGSAMVSDSPVRTTISLQILQGVTSAPPVAWAARIACGSYREGWISGIQRGGLREEDGDAGFVGSHAGEFQSRISRVRSA